MIARMLNKLSMREALLLSMFLWVIVVVWFSAVVADFRETRTSLSAVRTQEQYQRTWIDQAPSINLRLEESLQRLDPSKTFSDSQLAARLDTIARQSALTYDFTSNRTRSGDIFNIHERRLRIKDATLLQLIEFDQRLRENSPYMGIESVRLTADRRNPLNLDATFTVSSIELKSNSI